MMKRNLVGAVVASAVATIAIVACGGSSTNGNSGADSGAIVPGVDSGNAGSGDGAVTPPGTDGGGSISDAATGANPPLPDGAIPPHGNQLADGGALALNGVTSDDYAVYTDLSSNGVYAISLTPGSAAISLGTADQNDDVIVLGKAVIVGTSSSGGGNNGPTVGAASIWTSGASAPASLGSAVVLYNDYANEIAVSADNTRVLFVDDVNAAGTGGNLYVAALDGTAKTLLVGSVDVAYDVCTAAVAFAGTYAVAAYCVVPDGGAVDAGLDDGGTNFNVATVSSFTEASGTPATIATNVEAAFSADVGGTTVVVIGAGGTAAYPIAGGTAVTIDATGALDSVTYTPGLLTSDGAHLIYATTAEALDRAATTAPATPTQLAAAGTYSDVFALSPDGNWALGTLNQSNRGLTDLYLSSATAAGTPTTLDSTTDSYPFFGDPFTADSTHVVYVTGFGQQGGTLNARALTAGATATVLATNAAGDLATSGAKIIFDANATGTQNGTYADLSAVDTSQTAAPTLLVSAADLTFFLDSAKKTIVYTWSYESGANAGLWTLAAP
jgi:hypothetical protein